MFDLIREIAQTIRNNKLRTFLTGFAVAWGIFMLIILLGMARGVTNSFQSMRSAERSSSLTVYGGVTSEPYRGYKDGRSINPEVTDINTLPEKLPDIIEDVSSYKFLPSTSVSAEGNSITSSMEGVYPAEQAVDRVEISQGRFINSADINYNRKVVVIGKEKAGQLFKKPEEAVGKRVDAYGLSWLVVGVYDHKWVSDIYIPFTTAMQLSDNNRQVSNMRVKLRTLSTQEEADNAENAVRKELASLHSFSPDDRSAMRIYNRFSSYLRESTAFGILNASIWVIGIFTLLSGIVGVSNIMFVSVRERTHEIGIRRAIGAKPRSILAQVVTESVAITTLFGYIGIVFGMCIMQVVATVTAGSEILLNPTIDIRIAIEVTIVLIVAGALAGLFPAIKATKVKPVETLRDE